MSLPARLVFTWPTSDGLPARLVFGDDAIGPIAPVTLHGAGRITGLRGYVRGRIGVSLRSGGKVTGLRGHVRGHYDVNVERPLVASTTQHGQAAAAMRMLGGDSWQDAGSLRLLVQQSSQQATPVPALMETLWQDAGALRVLAGQRAQQAKPLVQIIDQSFQDASALRVWAAHRAQQAQALRAMASGRFEDANPLRRFVQHAAESATPLSALYDQAGGQARAVHLLVMQRTQQATQPGWGKAGPVNPVQPKPCHPNLPALLCFDQPMLAGLPARLYFHCCDDDGEPEPGTPLIVPLKRVYMTVNRIEAVLLPSLERVQLSGINIDANDDGFGWSMSASGPLELMDQLAPMAGLPARIKVSFNGIDWVFAVDPPQRSRKFGDRKVQIGGRSTTSLLGSPYMPSSTWINDGDRTAQQLMLEALAFTGVSVDWRIDDWLVPQGVWSHQGTPLSAVLRIAEAAGAVVRSHKTDERLIIAPRYPHVPWKWSVETPNVILPAQVITMDALQPTANRPYEIVMVSGNSDGGIKADVVWTGTAGSARAEQITDPLITATEVARQRGIEVLSRSAITYQQSATMPLLAESGLIEPGLLLQVNEPGESWRGLVRSISLREFSPSVRQTMVLERYR